MVAQGFAGDGEGGVTFHASRFLQSISQDGIGPVGQRKADWLRRKRAVLRHPLMSLTVTRGGVKPRGLSAGHNGR